MTIEEESPEPPKKDSGPKGAAEREVVHLLVGTPDVKGEDGKWKYKKMAVLSEDVLGFTCIALRYIPTAGTKAQDVKKLTMDLLTDIPFEDTRMHSAMLQAHVAQVKGMSKDKLWTPGNGPADFRRHPFMPPGRRPRGGR